MHQDANSPLENDHNVYILGAGFSVEGGPPLVADFMNAMRDSVEWLQAKKRETEAEAVRKVLDFRLKAASAAYRAHLDVENIEELFSLAAASEGNELAQDVTLAIAATLDFAQTRTQMQKLRLYAPSRLANTPGDWDWSGEELSKRHGYYVPYYDFYAGIMGGYFGGGRPAQRDTIVTFN